MNAVRNSLLPIILVCVLVGFGCSSVEVQPDVDRVEIAEAVYLSLPKADSITYSVDATQILVADYGERSHTFEVQLEIRPGRITIASVNMWGGTLFSVMYDGSSVHTQRAFDEAGFDPKYLLADFLLTRWDADWLSEHLQGADLNENANGMGRILSRDGEPVIEISYDTADRWAGRTRFTHLERAYVLDIQTVGMSGS